MRDEQIQAEERQSLPFGFGNDRKNSAKLTFKPEDHLPSADAFGGAQQQHKDMEVGIAEKIECLKHYDVLAMQRVVAILAWGRSGSVLLASYFDGHEDVISLPEICGWRLFEFFNRYRSLSLRDKLLAYPTFDPNVTRFFEGDFAISPAEYYAAAEAIVVFYRDWPPEFLESRRAFFLFVHVAYNLALGRRPSNSNPLIVYAQHDWDNVSAQHLVDDFPQAKFLHTIRDPISSCDRAYHALLDTLAEQNIQLPYSVLDFLTSKDLPQGGMEGRSRAIRFEDLHCDIAKTMRDLSDWLGLSYQPILLESTFNGIPYVIKSEGKIWSGPRLEAVQRRTRHLSRADRALLFALFYENFEDWKYPCPKIFRHRIVRCGVVVSLLPFPMKTEIVGASAILHRRIWPALRRGNISRVIKSLVGIGLVRLKIMLLLVSVVFRRCVHRPRLVQVHRNEQPLETGVPGGEKLGETNESGPG